MPRNLIDITDLSVEEINQLIATAEDIIANPVKYQDACAHKQLATLFFEPSTRTRLSFESAMLALGGSTLGFSEASSSSTAKGETEDKVSGLEMGADDYIVKPFEVKELLARVHAVLRRTGDDGKPKSKKLTFDKLVINLDSYELIVDGKKIDTPPKEMELLYHLAATPNRVYTRNQLLDEVWGFDYFGDSRTVDVHIKRLREKLEGVSDKWALKTVWGVGYKFEAEET